VTPFASLHRSAWGTWRVTRKLDFAHRKFISNAVNSRARQLDDWLQAERELEGKLLSRT
jgi:hypothetical protein